MGQASAKDWMWTSDLCNALQEKGLLGVKAASDDVLGVLTGVLLHVSDLQVVLEVVLLIVRLQ